MYNNSSYVVSILYSIEVVYDIVWILRVIEVMQMRKTREPKEPNYTLIKPYLYLCGIIRIEVYP